MAPIDTPNSRNFVEVGGDELVSTSREIETGPAGQHIDSTALYDTLFGLCNHETRDVLVLFDVDVPDGVEANEASVDAVDVRAVSIATGGG